MAEAQLGASFTCAAAVKRAVEGPDDWTKIIGSGQKYVDVTMPADSSMIVWTGFARTDNAKLSSYLGYVKSFKRPT